MDKIRKSIQSNMQKKITQNKETSLHTSILPSIEESHGYADIEVGPTPPQKNNQPEHSDKPVVHFSFLQKLMVSMGIFIVMMITNIMINQYSPTSQFTNQMLTEDFPFATVYDWYEENIHSLANPFLDDTHLDVQQHLPDNTVVETFQMNGTGMLFKPDESTDLYAISDGIVIFSGMRSDTNRTIIVQHADRTKAIYGNLSFIDVPLYKRVKKHEKIGSFANDMEDDSLFLAIEKAGIYIDPLSYIVEVDTE